MIADRDLIDQKLNNQKRNCHKNTDQKITYKQTPAPAPAPTETPTPAPTPDPTLLPVDGWCYGSQGLDWDADVSGALQSPIDLPLRCLLNSAINEELDVEVKFSYGNVPRQYVIKHLPHRSILVSSEDLPMGVVEVDGKCFTVAQFHMHAPSEHLIDGMRHQLELHIVHQFSGYAESGETVEEKVTKFTERHHVAHEDELVVVGVIFQSTPDSPDNPFLSSLLSIPNFPLEASEVPLLVSHDAASPLLHLYNLFPRTGKHKPDASDSATETEDRPNNRENKEGGSDAHRLSFLRYFGSLTTPPLTEVVNWFIHSEVVPASSLQMQLLSDALKYPGTDGNFRCANGRRGTPHTKKDSLELKAFSFTKNANNSSQSQSCSSSETLSDAPRELNLQSSETLKASSIKQGGTHSHPHSLPFLLSSQSTASTMLSNGYSVDLLRSPSSSIFGSQQLWDCNEAQQTETKESEMKKKEEGQRGAITCCVPKPKDLTIEGIDGGQQEGAQLVWMCVGVCEAQNN